MPNPATTEAETPAWAVPSLPPLGSGGGSTRSFAESSAQKDASNFATKIEDMLPKISYPKSGGSLASVGEKFSASPATGAGSLSIPIATPRARGGVEPSLALSYSTGSGNGPFGMGWSLGLGAVSRRTDKGLPRYRDGTDEEDIFTLSGEEDLVPQLSRDAPGKWTLPPPDERVSDNQKYQVRKYVPRTESSFSSIEKWTSTATGDSYWRVISAGNVTTYYGTSDDCRIRDPDDHSRVFSWLVSKVQDDEGNEYVVTYKREDSANVDVTELSERNRTAQNRTANLYLKSIKYGNVTSTYIKDRPKNDFLFEVILDYGEHNAEAPKPDDSGSWLCRNDPISLRRSTFEIRTYRLCQRILIFHNFPDEPEVGADCLVKAYELTYRSNRGLSDDQHQGNPLCTFLEKVQYKSYRRVDGNYRVASLPPLELSYSIAKISDDVNELPASALANIPAGLDGHTADLVDLDGEGIAGILTQRSDAWYYKSPLGGGDFAPLVPVPLRPNVTSTAANNPKQLLVDVDGDGMLDAVSLEQGLAGYWSRSWDIDMPDWQDFKHFTEIPVLDWKDPNLRFIDLTGDGMPDILMSENDVISWFPSLSADGFGPRNSIPKPFDEELGPKFVFGDVLHSIFLADMTGDGLVDLVRVTRNEICYWPNLGYGVFGSKIAMSNIPILDTWESFDATRVKLGDIDGTGTADLIYVGSRTATVYRNQAGNSWADGERLANFPVTDNLTTVRVVDLLGNGTGCLVWSSNLPVAGPSVKYIDLTSGVKPHLLNLVVNNLGSETKITYKPSTKFYLDDKMAGKVWPTRLPFPIQVVEKVENFEKIGRTYFSTRHAYHFGHYDVVEREFVGFGMVEQWDTEEFATLEESQAANWSISPQNLNAESHVPPVYTKTWFHLGLWRNKEDVSAALSKYYWQEPGSFMADELVATRIGTSSLPSNIQLQSGQEETWDVAPQELREACRALRGSLLRVETYALDGLPAQSRPYTVSEANFSVHLIQPITQHADHAVFTIHPTESLDVHYERLVVPGNTPDQLIADPRTAHDIVLSTDFWGNVLKSVSIAYGRRITPVIDLPSPDDLSQQTKIYVSYEEREFTNAVLGDDSRRLPLQCEGKLFEITNAKPRGFQPAQTVLFKADEILSDLAIANDGNHDLDFNDVAGQGATSNDPYRRLIEHSRLFFMSDDLTGSLPFKQIQSMALPYQGQQLVYTDSMIQKCSIDGGRLSSVEMQSFMTDTGRFIHSMGDSNWWTWTPETFYSPNALDTPAQELEFAKSNFFLTFRYRDQFHSDNFNTETKVTYDKYKLFPTEREDALKNRETVGVRDPDPTKPLLEKGFDYRVLAATHTTDSNGNVLACAYDTFGACVGTATMAKPNENLGDSFDRFDVDLTDAQLQQYFADPLTVGPTILGTASTRVVYSPYAYYNSLVSESPVPCFTSSIGREIHVSDLTDGQVSPLQYRFDYMDGLGRIIQSKSQVEPGPVPQRDPTTGTIVVSDGKVVMGGNVSPRWVGSGWTVFNNKGQAVEKFDPFFTDRISYEFDTRIGVSSVIMYDSLGRLVATLSPDHTWRKTVFDPWREEVWDSNDTIAIPDPSQDVDVGGYFARFKSDKYLPAWYAARKDGQLGSAEQRAAQNSLLHAATPTISHLDSLGRRFIGETRNVFLPSDDPTATPKTETYTNKMQLDIQGHNISLIDALSRVAGTNVFDMLHGPITQHSMDTGDQACLNDVAGRTAYAWDAKGVRFRHEYDQLQRLVKIYAKADASSAEVLLEQSVYGDTITPNPENGNLRGQVFQFKDASGTTTTPQYDFKGNVLRLEQALVKDYKQTIDWNGAVELEDQIFVTTSKYNALDVPVAVTAPDQSVLIPQLDKANRYKSLQVNIQGTRLTTLLTNVDYNAKSMRTSVSYGNKVRTQFTFDDLNDRLMDVVSSRNAQDFPDDSVQPTDPNWPGSQIQSLHYTFDPVGNITSIRDDAQQKILFDGMRVDASNDYVYDAVYRLIEATGREYLGGPNGTNPTPPDPESLFGQMLPLRGQGTLMGRYTERYEYDYANNITAVKHVGSSSAKPGWTRNYSYANQSNRLISTTIGNKTDNYGYNGAAGVNGHITDVPHLSKLQWNLKDQLSVTSKQKVNNGGTPETTYYVYDSVGQRVRKVTERQADQNTTPTRKSETIYIGGYEIYREYATDGVTVTSERETLRVRYGGGKLIANIETKTKLADSNVGPVQEIRYQLGNHLGSTNIELDEQAKILSYEEYSPFGSTTYQAVSNQSDVPKRYRYTSKERDEESGFYYFGARYYMPWLGRWLSADPEGFVDGLNLYAYTMNNPISLSDPSGTEGQRTEDHNFHPYPFSGNETPSQLQDILHKMGLEYEGYAKAEKFKNEGTGKDEGIWHVERLYRYDSASGARGSLISENGIPVEGGTGSAGGVPGGGGATPGGPPGGPGGTSGGGGGGGSGGGKESGRSFWNRGGSLVFWGAVGIAIGVALALSPVGWLVALTAALGLAAGITSVGVGLTELAMSYTGQTTAKQEAELNEATETTTLFAGSVPTMIGGTLGAVATHDQEGLKHGAEAGAVLDLLWHLPQALRGLGGLGRTLYREGSFGFPKNWNPAYKNVLGDIRRVYGIANDALRRRPNLLFNFKRNKTGIRNIEWIDISHVFQHAKIKGTWMEWFAHRPTFLVPMWETNHALLDPFKWRFLSRASPAFEAAYQGQRVLGPYRYFLLLHQDTQDALRLVPQINTARKVWNAKKKDDGTN